MWIKAPSKYTRKILQGPFIKVHKFFIFIHKVLEFCVKFCRLLFILGGWGGVGDGGGVFSPRI